MSDPYRTVVRTNKHTSIYLHHQQGTEAVQSGPSAEPDAASYLEWRTTMSMSDGGTQTQLFKWHNDHHT